jgi:outer membrane protein assembly factor BamA/autotransporter translocation and assembly factor TamB
MTASRGLRSIARVVGFVALAAGLCAVALLVGAHLPWVQARVGQWARSQLLSRGIAIQTQALAYNLFTLRVHVEGLVASTTADTSSPFLEVSRIDVSLPRSILTGRLAVTSVVADGARVMILRRRDGSTNLPESAGGDTTRPPSPFPIGTLALSNASVVWRDEVLDMSVEAQGVSVNLRPASRGSSGALTLDRPATVRAGNRTTAIAADARIDWDGSTLSIGTMRLSAAEGTVAATGSVGLLVDRMPIAIDVSGGVEISRLADWLAPGEHPAGSLTFRARATGSAADPRAEITLESRNLAWRGLSGVSADASLHFDRATVDIGPVNVRLLGGTAGGRGRIALAPVALAAERASASLDWRGIDVPSLLKAARVDLPVRVNTAVDGQANASWTTWTTEGLSGDLKASTRSTPDNAHALGFNGTVTLSTRAGQWEGTIDQWLDRAVHLEGHAGGRLMPESLAASTIAAAVVATADSWPDVWLTLREIDLVGGAAPAGVTGGGRAELTLAGRLDNPGLAGHVDATLPDLAQLRGIAPATLRPSGRLSVSAALSGTARRPVVDGTVAVEAPSFAGQSADRLDASFGLAGDTLRIDALSLTQDGGTLSGNGEYDLRTREVSALLTASGLTIVPVPGSAPDEILAPIAARISGEWQAGGTSANPQGSGHLELDGTRILARDIGRVTTRLALADDRLSATVDLVDLFTTGTATLGLSSPGSLTIDAQTKDAELRALASRLGVDTVAPVTGTVSFATRIEGERQDLAHLRAIVDLERLDAAVGDVPVRSTQPGRASYDGRAVEIADLALTIGASDLRIAGRIGAEAPGTLTASLDGEARDLEQLAASFLPPGSAASRVMVDGRVHLEVRDRGSLERPSLDATASLDEGRVTIAEQPQASSLTVRASYDAGVLTLSRFDAVWQGATLAATGEVPIALVATGAPVWLTGTPPSPQTPGRLRARIDSITPAVLASFVPADKLSQLSGLVSGTLTLDADGPVLSSVHGQLVLDRAELNVAGVPFAQRQPTRVDVANGRAQIVEWEWGGAGDRFSLSGGVQFDGQRTLDVSVDSAIDLRLLSAFLPRATAGGRGVLKARAFGALSDPKIEGRIDLEAGEWRNASPRLAITDLTGSLLLSGDDLTVENLYGQANGGFVSVAGTLKRRGLQLVSGKLAISGQGLAMAIPEALKTQVDLELTLAVDRGAFSLTGDAVVLGGSYREPLSLTSGLVEALSAAPAIVQLDDPSAASAIALDVRLTTGEDIVVDNNYAQLALAADIRIGGTPTAPTLLGRAEVRDGGRIFLGGNVYQIDGAGVIDFANPSRIEPDLAITALTRVSGESITLNLKGTPATLETTLSSDSGLSQGEMVSLLVTGQKDSTGALAISSDQVIGYLSGEVLGVTGRALGLDALRIERGQDVRFDAGLVASETDPASRLTFGKQVGRNVELVFSQSLKDSGKFTWIIGYRPKPSIELRFVSQDNEDRIYDFRHDVTIGGGAVAPRVSRPAGQVASLRFTGTPGVPDTVLHDALRLTEGKSFDFFRWQEDQDRLAAELRQDGHFEARVSARRSSPSSDGASAIDLTYDVHRGPRTVVDIEGVPNEGALRPTLERLWSEAVLDEFLVEEARNAARVAMVLDGYVRATATAAIDRRNGGDEKHLVVRGEPGPRFSRRELRFTGQQQVARARLEGVARVTASPWVDPAPLVKAVTAMYRDEGFLDAAVMVDPPRFEGATAILPITINEGPLFHLGSVALVGARARTPEGNQKAFGLEPGVVLTRASADAAAESLTSAYRADGFNTVRVTLTSQATRATGLVALTVTIDEGPRQVVREIATQGLRRTSPELVSRELKLDLGQPVDRLAWAQARKRLYDTSVFRQVDIQAVPIDRAGPVEPGADNPAAVVEQPIQAHVTLEEWPPLRVRYGFELDEQRQPASESRDLRPGVAADATYRNVFGRAATTGLALRYTKDFQAARAFFSKPSFLGLPLTSNLFLARSREQIGGSTARPSITDKSDFTAEQRFRAGRRLQMAYSYNFERNHSFNPNANPDDLDASGFTINIARLTATALVDTRDDLVDATRGVLFSSTFEYSTNALGSDLRFAKYFVQQNYYRTIGRGVVFATSGRLGLAAGYGQDLVFSEKFFAGGGNSVRGFTDDTLGPADPLGGPAGGNALLVFNEELRFPIAWRFRGVGFFDAGSAFETVGDLRLRGLRPGVGAGLRVQTPLVLLRADVGTPVRPRPGEPRVQWFFSIGQAF